MLPNSVSCICENVLAVPKHGVPRILQPRRVCILKAAVSRKRKKTEPTEQIDLANQRVVLSSSRSLSVYITFCSAPRLCFSSTLSAQRLPLKQAENAAFIFCPAEYDQRRVPALLPLLARNTLRLVRQRSCPTTHVSTGYQPRIMWLVNPKTFPLHIWP